MDSTSFREFGKAAVDFIADYLETIRNFDVLSSVKPGYLIDLLPQTMPERGESWKNILEDIDKVILPGITHWQSPNMHAFYPTASSYPSIVGEMLTAGLSVMGFNWICSPACTELEIVVMDWLAKFMKLPERFLHCSEGPGGGIIQGSASEAILVALLAAREHTVHRVMEANDKLLESEIRGKLVAYSSDQSNSCVEKAGTLAAVPIRLLPCEDDFKLKGNELQNAIIKDLNNGFIPIICISTLGTTATCAFDDIETIGKICEKYHVWLHVDAAYAGAALALEEFSDLHKGLEYVDSINFNLHKFLKVNFDCCAMWLKDSKKVVDNFNVERIYLKHSIEDKTKIPDFRNWQIPLGRRFRALKVWITFRTEGTRGLKKHIRKHIALAERFGKHVLNDDRFEIITKPTLGLVCFCPKGESNVTRKLLLRITERKKIYIIQATHNGKVFLRFVICGMDPKEEDVDFAWNEIQTQLTEILYEQSGRSVMKFAISEKGNSFDVSKIDISSFSEKLATNLKCTDKSFAKSQ